MTVIECPQAYNKRKHSESPATPPYHGKIVRLTHTNSYNLAGSLQQGRDRCQGYSSAGSGNSNTRSLPGDSYADGRGPD
jgi:hypothetical protein